MHKHIFVATDGSDTAMRAVDLAAEIAAKFEVPLTLGHVLQFDKTSEELDRMAESEHLVEHVSRSPHINFQSMTGSMADLFAESRPRDDSVRVMTMIGDELVRRGADRAKDIGVKSVHTTTSQGDPADAILGMAEEVEADLIVVGHRGLGALQRWLQGSVAEKVNKDARTTVVTVR
jgi:nucleotide-binding universal stress UspA family protein